MKRLNYKDKKRREEFLRKEFKIRMYKVLSKNDYVEDKEKWEKKLKKVGGLEVKINNRCIESGRGGGVYRYFKLSRMEIKRKLKEKELVGVKKASW